MENLYSFTWNSEYVISLAAAFLPFALVLPKRKYGILMMIAGFIAIYGLWFTRTIPGYSFGFDVLYYIAIYIGLVFLIRYSC